MPEVDKRFHLKNPAIGNSRSSDKWGEITKGGFQIVPDVFVRHQGYLKITSEEMCVLLNIMMFWWRKETKPRISSQKTSERTGLAEADVKRAIDGLVEKGLIKKILDTQQRTAFDLDPLVKKLSLLAQVEEIG